MARWSIFAPYSPLSSDDLLLRESYVLLQSYSVAVKQINSQLRNASLAKAIRLRNLRKQINLTIKKLNIVIAKNAKKVMYGYVHSAQELAKARLIKLGAIRLKGSFTLLNTRTVNVFADQMLFDLVTANESMLKTTSGYLRATQQKAIREETINKLLQQGVITGVPRKAISDELYTKIEESIGSGKYIKINGRNYDPKKYAELVTRTRMREAASEGTINMSLEYGSDLVQVSVHEHNDRPGDTCPEYAGKIYSISGNDPDFPPLIESPPFHPNCKHVLLPVVKEALQIRGTYEKLVTFSRGTNSVDTLAEYARLGL